MSAAASLAAAPAAGVLGGVLALCHAIEDLPAGGSGTLAIAARDGGELGGVVVRDRRVCGAITAGGAGGASPAPPRAIRLRELASAIAVLADGGARRWIAGPTSGDAPTFAASEVLIGAVAAHAPRANLAQAIELAPWPTRDATLVAYAVDHATDLLLPVARSGDGELSVAAVMALGRAGQEALIAAGCLGGRPRLVLAGLGAAAIATWADADLLYVARLDGPEATARLAAGWAAMQESG